VSLTRINREERVALNPLSTRHHYAQISDALIDVADEVAVDVALHLDSAGIRWAFAKVKVVVDLESEP